MIFGMNKFKMAPEPSFLGGGGGGGNPPAGGGGNPPANDPPAGDPPPGNAPPAGGGGNPPAGDPPPADPPAGGGVQYQYPSDLDPSYHGNATLLKYANEDGSFRQGDVYKALIHATQSIGADKMLVPNQQSTPEQWAEAFQKLGKPDNIDAYEVKNNLPEGMKGNEDLLKQYRQLAFDQNLLPSQAQAILDFHNKFAADTIKAQDTSHTESVNAVRAKLEQEWGQAFNDNMNKAENALKHFFPDEATRQAVINSGFLDTEVGTRFFHRLADGLKEGTTFNDDATGGFNLTPAELDDKIKSIHAELIKMGKQHPQYASKMQEYQSTLEKRHGTAKVSADGVVPRV